ncbi:MAG: TetR family transcriptional regulator [Actinobacteria bacterium]|nr:TetR family transcriptional regulator [Actinomycetota bacterium]
MPRPSRWPEVMAAAAKVFRAKGYHAATLEDVADEVGMLKGSLYNYITSKEELLFAVVRPPAEQLLEQTRALVAAEGTAPGKVVAIARVHAGVLAEHFVYAAVYVHEIAGMGRYPEWAAMDHEYVELVRAVLAAGVAEGSLRADLDVRTAGHVLIGSLNWLTRWWDPDGPASAEEMADRVSATFLDGSRSRPAR